jgi:hypothetical protein
MHNAFFSGFLAALSPMRFSSRNLTERTIRSLGMWPNAIVDNEIADMPTYRLFISIDLRGPIAKINGVKQIVKSHGRN